MEYRGIEKPIEAAQESTHLEVDEQALHGSVGVVDYQMEVELLDE